MECSMCSTANKKIKTLQKECKYWQEKYCIEKKCATTLIQWVFGVFGFIVTIEFDKESNGIKICGRESSKEDISQAAIPSSGGNNKIMIMEDKMQPGDFLEDFEERSALAEILNEAKEGEESTEDINDESHEQQNVCRLQLQQPEEDAIINILNDQRVQQQQHFIIVKSSEGCNEIIPMQIECSENTDGDHFLIPDKIGDGGNNHQMFFKLNTSSLEQENASNRNLQGSQGTQTPVHPITQNANVEKCTPPAQPIKTLRQRKLSGSGNLTMSPLFVNNSVKKQHAETTQPVVEFGLTLREKAEVYVQTKAKSAIKKTSQGYICSECSSDYVFSSVQNALTHTKTHFEQYPYKCPVPGCDAVFAIQKKYLSHRKEHQAKRYVRKGNDINTNGKIQKSTPTTNDPFSSPSKTNSALSTHREIIYTISDLIQPSSSSTASTITASQNPLLQSATAAPTKLLKLSLTQSPPDKNVFKCNIPGCKWSYETNEELNWHLTAHAQSRV